MKRLLQFVALLAMVCFSTAALAADAANLVGTWEGTPSVHGKKAGYGTSKLTLVVSEQKGNVFSGSKIYKMTSEKKETKEGFSGTVSSTGQIFIADHDEGFMIGAITKAGELELQYGHQGKDAVAVHVLLKKK